jgi:hypothetical protein
MGRHSAAKQKTKNPFERTIKEKPWKDISFSWIDSTDSPI